MTDDPRPSYEGDRDDRRQWDGRGTPRNRQSLLGEILESLGD